MNLLPGSSEDALIALVNQANTLSQPLVEGDLYFGKVKTLSDGSGRVEIPAVAMYDSAYEGYVKFRYKRLNLSQAFGGIRPKLRDIGYPSLHQLLPVINKALGTALETKDVIDTNIAWLNNNEEINIQITASANSIGYEGNFIVTFTRIRPMLQKVITNPDLDILDHPVDPTLSFKSIGMALYSLDFTDYPNETRVYTPLGIWANIGILQTLMAKFGFPNWPNGARNDVVTYVTKDVPEANQAFTHVTVQKNVTVAGHKGNAYFHFNRS